ncbi:hypothetical protein CRP01_41320 [Flavilitoribacter nigricans DSM 23189 = NBRC 102662]|uniref:Uncharacterized protein n=1 Tax=Flavilitoribacter nigricans (strain ATCC 23147 / DSM 23189 / NBRC 102662 / NCIMB 1420 / SS-2) TaxID=1122177 RepID=A0A2D0MWG6_FLAN2|nr:hypothetical protein CRP01_41320 [Flavilitoribacter nigricans DSM 23189 = NBRC 102662]
MMVLKTYMTFGFLGEFSCKLSRTVVHNYGNLGLSGIFEYPAAREEGIHLAIAGNRKLME